MNSLQLPWRKQPNFFILLEVIGKWYSRLPNNSSENGLEAVADISDSEKNVGDFVSVRSMVK